MPDITRRLFLRNAGMGVAAAGTAAAVPGLVGATSKATSKRPLLPAAVTRATRQPAAPGSTAVVAHVVDASSGLIAVYAGTEEFSLHSPDIARALLKAAE